MAICDHEAHRFISHLDSLFTALRARTRVFAPRCVGKPHVASSDGMLVVLKLALRRRVEGVD